MSLLKKRKLQRYLFPAIAVGFCLLWLISTAVLWGNWRFEKQRIEETLRHDSETALGSKVTEIEGILQQIYLVARTISLLPGVRSTVPVNRNSEAEDVVSLGKLSSSDYDTIQQLYNHIASSVEVSEIYIVYDGFDPLRGQVPFVMFDQIIVDRFEKISGTGEHFNDGDIPEEYEDEEYQDYLRQLNYLRHNKFEMPNGSLDDIHPINSGLMRTCDNSQYHSIPRGDVRHTHGFTISVPIYDLETRKFKGLVTAVLRSNVLEAALIGWPVLPVTEADQEKLAAIPGLDVNSPPVNYLLEEQTSGIRISDGRNRHFATIRKTAAYHFQKKLDLPGSSNWQLHNYVPQTVVSAAMLGAHRHFSLQTAALSLVVVLLWFSVNAVFRSQRKTATQLRQLAEIDPLTGLPNRRMIGMYMTTMLSATAREQHSAVMMIDLDDFKQVNDSMGHEAGDRMLIEIAHRFNRILRDEDCVLRISVGDGDGEDQTISSVERVMGRLGGDEFLVILGGLPSKEMARGVASRLLTTLDQPIEIGMEKIYARVSMGISVYPDDGEDAAALLRSADIALYEAKRRGRGQIVVFEAELDADAMRRLQMVTALHEAVQEQQFFLLYQPELHVKTGKINAVEALLRWQHPEFGLVMPYEFIPLLESSGLIIEAGGWILRSACRQFKDWSDMGLPIQIISVNISPKQLTQPDFPDMVEEILNETGIQAESLVLEVTESIFMDKPELAIQSLSAVRELGVKVAIDDFGTGYSSLSYLRKIPLDILKIDRSFVNETNTVNGVAICDMLIELAGRLGLKVVAEGIETQLQLISLQRADWIQGYYVSRPLMPEDLAQKVREISLHSIGEIEPYPEVRKSS